jgi:hypothetical protein
MPRFVFLLALFASIPVATAATQTIEINTNPSQPPAGGAVRINTNQAQSFAAGIEQVHVGVNVNIFVPASGDDSEQVVKAQETGRKLVYELAGHECAVLRDVLASECRLESVNVNIQRQNQFGNQMRTDGFNINGNLGFRIVPK